MNYIEYYIRATLHGFYILTETIHSRPPVVTTYEIPLLTPPSLYLSGTGKPLDEDFISQSLLNGYQFPVSKQVVDNFLQVAFTVRSSSVKGGGPLMVYRYAEWLARLGVYVTIYSDDALPRSQALSARFLQYSHDVDRYSAITEPIVIVYSVLELPALLKYCSTAGKQIYHLCQGLENFHYIPPQDKDLAISVPIFDLLNSLPIPRIAVSPHIEMFLAERYGHKPFTIPNGIDLDMFYPLQRSSGISRHVSVLVFGNPEIPLKGVVAALVGLVLARRELPEYSFHLNIVCGEDISARYESQFEHDGVCCTVYYCLEPEQVRSMFHKADLYINASYYEGFGLPSLEAMACAVPVVQVDNHGLDGIAIDGENCVISPSQSPHDIARAVVTVLTDVALRAHIVESGLRTVQRFSVQQQFAAFCTQFQQILGVHFDERRVRDIMDSPLVTPPPHVSVPVEPGTPDFNCPTFSVLIPTYNQAQYLPACLDSLLAQTCSNWEAVIVNDGSTDDTRSVLEHYAHKDSRFTVLHKENGGVASALNLALKNARGRWICWLSSDDMFMPDKLEQHIRGFIEYPDTYFFHTAYNVFYEDTCRLEEIGLPADFIPQESLQVLKFFEINYVNGISICVHRSVFGKVGGFNTNLRNGQDFDMWLRISAQYRSRHLEARTCITRVHPEQGSSISSDAGIFDSALACLDFLNNHSFESLFPVLSVSQAADGMFAIQNVLKILINPQAYINTCGYGAVLLARMREWLGKPENRQVCELLGGGVFTGIVASIQDSSLPAAIKAAFCDLHTGLGKPYIYQAVDAVSVLKSHLVMLAETPGNADTVRSLQQYIVKRFGAENVGNEKNNVAYWQALQKQGYFENHICYGHDHNGLKLFGDDDKYISRYLPLTRLMNVVVIGCGYGRESVLIARHVRQVFGIDVDDVVLEKAKAFTLSHGISNFVPVHAEHWRDGIPEGIDLVYSMVVFQHLTRHLARDYIVGMIPKMSPQGRFLCQFCEAENGSYDASLHEYEPNVSWTEGDIRQLMIDCGLVLYQLETTQVSRSAKWHWAFFGLTHHHGEPGV